VSYVPDNDPRLSSAREQVRMAFEVGNLCSVSRLPELLDAAYEALDACGLPRRRSLALMVARQAQAAWAGQMDAVKAQA
jgi:hypothetical protein